MPRPLPAVEIICLEDLLAFSLFAGERFRREFCLCDVGSGERLSDGLELSCLKVPKHVNYGTLRFQ